MAPETTSQQVARKRLAAHGMLKIDVVDDIDDIEWTQESSQERRDTFLRNNAKVRKTICQVCYKRECICEGPSQEV